MASDGGRMEGAMGPAGLVRSVGEAPPRAAVRGARFVRLVGTCALVLGVAGCSSGGPADVGPGQYRLYATSADVVEPAGADLTIEGSAVSLRAGSGTKTVTMGEPGAEYTVCPPSGTGAPRPLDGPLTIGDLQLEEPAIVGDCGRTKPVRVTVVDLASVDEANQFPFTRWAEFCDVADPDCS